MSAGTPRAHCAKAGDAVVLIAKLCVSPSASTCFEWDILDVLQRQKTIMVKGDSACDITCLEICVETCETAPDCGIETQEITFVTGIDIPTEGDCTIKFRHRTATVIACALSDEVEETLLEPTDVVIPTLAWESEECKLTTQPTTIKAYICGPAVAGSVSDLLTFTEVQVVSYLTDDGTSVTAHETTVFTPCQGADDTYVVITGSDCPSGSGSGSG